MMNCFATRIIQKRVLKRIACSHKGKFVSLYSARRIGFVINACQCGAEQAVKFISQTLTVHGIKYKGICLDLKKEPSKNLEHIHDREITIVSRRNVNWYGLPEESTVSEFIQQPYDILMDLTAGTGLFTADYILKKTSASFRIGTAHGQSGIYDMIVSAGDRDADTGILAESILEYLTSIHTGLNSK